MNPYPITVDPTTTQGAKYLRNHSRECRRHYRRCELARLRALRLLMESHNVPAIFVSLRPARASMLAQRAASRMREIAMKHYRLFLAAADTFNGK